MIWGKNEGALSPHQFERHRNPLQNTKWKGREGSVATPGAVREETPTGAEIPTLGLINSVD